MESINEQLNPAHGWSSGRRMPQGEPARGVGKSGLNNDVLGWVPGTTGVAIRLNETGTPWFYRVLSVPGFEATWQACRYNGEPKFETIEAAIRWAKTKKFNGLNIID